MARPLRSRNTTLREQAMRRYESATLKALRKAAARGEEIERNLISTPYPPASAPHAPPHARHPQEGLRDSIDHEVDERDLVARIGSNKRHLLFLELGTSRMAPRPSLRKMLEMLGPEFPAELKASFAVVTRSA